MGKGKMMGIDDLRDWRGWHWTGQPWTSWGPQPWSLPSQGLKGEGASGTTTWCSGVHVTLGGGGVRGTPTTSPR